MSKGGKVLAGEKNSGSEITAGISLSEVGSVLGVMCHNKINHKTKL